MTSLERFTLNLLTNNPPRAMVPPALRVAMIALREEIRRARVGVVS